MNSRGGGKRERRTPRVRPVERIELSERHIILRFVFVGLFLALGVAGIAIGVKQLFGVSSGWREISPTGLTSTAAATSEELTLTYYVGSGNKSAARDNREVTVLYGDALNDADALYDSTRINGKNLAYLNAHPNEWVTVEPALYRGLSLIASSGCRTVYLGPLAGIYYDLFFTSDGSDLSDVDPALNPILGAFCSDVAAYARDPESIDLRLGDGNQVMLSVSESYLNYAAENEATPFVDLFWFRNAFLIDYIAGVLTDAGYVAGYITSVDGFSRNLCPNETSFSYQVFDLQGSIVYIPCELQYAREMSIVRFKAYPLLDDPDWFYVVGADGGIRHPYIGVAAGLPQAAISDLLGYSRTAGCAEIALRLATVYIADSFSPDALSALASDGIGSIYTENRKIHVAGSAINVTELYEEAGYSLAED